MGKLNHKKAKKSKKTTKQTQISLRFLDNVVVNKKGFYEGVRGVLLKKDSSCDQYLLKITNTSTSTKGTWGITESVTTWFPSDELEKE